VLLSRFLLLRSRSLALHVPRTPLLEERREVALQSTE